MNMIIWNVRGLNHPLKQMEVVGRIRKLKVNFVCLLETRVKQCKLQQILNRHFLGWKLFHNYSEALNGRIWVLWNGGMQVDLVASTDQSITCKIEVNSKTFFFSAIYGCNQGIERRRLWDHLAIIHSRLSKKPWFLTGDFNIIANTSESYPVSQIISNDMREFMDTMLKLSVFDHAFAGPILTWTNHQADGFIARKLDRALVNDNWFPMINNSVVEFLPPEVSDHSPIHIQLQQVEEGRPKPFRFFNFWTKHTAFLSIVEQSWNKPIAGGAMYILHEKLKRLKAELRRFNKTYFGNISAKVEEKRKELADIQIQILNFPSNDILIEREKSLTKEFSDMLKAEESFYRQKSRIDWIKEGDQNTKFFQKMTAAGQNRSSIRYLIDVDGHKLSSFDQISNEAVGFFQKLIGQRDVEVTGCNKELLSEIVQTVLPESAGVELCKAISSEEIRESLFSINGDKAPGPDGYTSHFFRIA